MNANKRAKLVGRRGAALATSLILLLVIMLLGATTARVTVQGEKAARNERDVRAAFSAAEAALLDAEEDIDWTDKDTVFLPPDRGAFIAGCGAAATGISHGLCLPAATGKPPVWLTVDLLNVDEDSARTVAYGSITGRLFSSGEGPQTALPPRYLIELLTPQSDLPIVEGDAAQAAYRITTVGFGMRESTHVVLQAVYRRERIPIEKGEHGEEPRYEYRSRRLSWREIPHWQELHDATKKK